MSGEQPFLEIDIDGEIRKIIRQLDTLPNQLKAPNVLAKAMNSTANEIKRKLGKDARKRYAVTDDRVLKDKSRGGMYLERTSGATVTAALISKGSMLDVMAYMTKPNDQTTAAMLKVLNESGMTALEVEGRKAFVTTFRSGHTAIVQRRGHDRLPVKKLLAPAAPHVFGGTYEEMDMDYYAILQKHISKQVEKVLGDTGRAA